MPRLNTKTWNTVAPRVTVKQYGGMGGGSTFAGATGTGVFQYARNQKRDEVDWDWLRIMRAAIPWLAAGIDIRCDEVTQSDYKVGAKQGEDDLSDGEKALARSIEDFLEAPDSKGINTTWTSLNAPVIEDMLVVGKGVIFPIFDKPGGGTLVKLRRGDALRLKENPEWDPDDPEAQDALDSEGNLAMPRYWYLDKDKKSGVINQQRGKPLKNGDVCVIKPREVTYAIDGLSPMLYLREFIKAHEDTFNSIASVQRDRGPSQVLKMPAAQPRTVNRLNAMLRRMMRGGSGVRAVSIPADSELLALTDVNLTQMGSFSFIDILVRGVAAALRMSTVSLGWTRSTLEHTGAEQGEEQDQGSLNLLRLVQDFYNGEIMPLFPGGERLKLRFVAIPTGEEAESVDAIAKWTGNHFVVPSPDELCRRAGLDVVEREEGTLLDRAYKDMWVVTGGTFLPIFMALGLAPNQMAPGYDPETGEIDEQKAQEIAQQKLEGAQQMMMAQTQAKLGALPPPGANGQNGGQRQLPPPNGGSDPMAAAKAISRQVLGEHDDDLEAAFDRLGEHLTTIYPRVKPNGRG